MAKAICVCAFASNSSKDRNIRPSVPPTSHLLHAQASNSILLQFTVISNTGYIFYLFSCTTAINGIRPLGYVILLREYIRNHVCNFCSYSSDLFGHGILRYHISQLFWWMSICPFPGCSPDVCVFVKFSAKVRFTDFKGCT